MPVLADQASLALYLEEDGLVLASVGEGSMDTPTPVLLTRYGRGGVVGGVAGAGQYPIDTPVVELQTKA